MQAFVTQPRTFGRMLALHVGVLTPLSLAGIGLSLVGMVAAALGYLTPVQGALLQEAIDVAVILNALRALGGHESDRMLAR